MAKVPAGAIVTYRGHWPQPGVAIWSANSYVGAVTAALAGDGFSTRDSKWNATLFGAVRIGGMDVELILQNVSRLQYGSEDDVIAIIRHEVYGVAGGFPTSDAIPTIQVPGDVPQGTGEPAGPTPGDGSSGGVSGWLDSLTSKGLWAFGLIGFGILAAAILIFAEEHKP